MTLLQTYYYINNQLADPRTNNWMLISNPLYPLCLSILYLYVVFYAIPKFMHNRKAYQLKEFIIVYNIYQVIACSCLIYGIVSGGWSTHYDWFCQDVDTSDSPEAMRMASSLWWLSVVKITEFIETMVFALRKKHNQISFLHVYHHISTYFMSWLLAKYFPGGSYTFPPILNCLVHIMMYTYYLLALFKAPWLQNALAKFKPYMTKIQMGQFVIFLMYAAQGMRPSCNVSKNILYVFLPNIFLFFYLFYDFYKKAFLQKNK